jgi:Molybdopterin-binding domain of aldehyde dehydrogenase
MDPLELRRRNLIPDDAYPTAGPSGIKFEKLSHHEALAHLDAMIDYAGLRAAQERLRRRGIYRGIGFASFVEVTNPSAAFYGIGGARISTQDGATVRLDATGAIFCHSSVTEQGQGAEAVIAQCVASAFGVPLGRVRVILGDTDNVPYGGGTWASRAAGIGGEAAWQAGKALRANVLTVAGSILQAAPDSLDISNGVVIDRDGRERIDLDEVTRTAYFRPDTLPPGFQAELALRLQQLRGGDREGSDGITFDNPAHFSAYRFLDDRRGTAGVGARCGGFHPDRHASRGRRYCDLQRRPDQKRGSNRESDRSRNQESESHRCQVSRCRARARRLGLRKWRTFDCFDRTWGRFRSEMLPVPGNHDYLTKNAAPYYKYFGSRLEGSVVDGGTAIGKRFAFYRAEFPPKHPAAWQLFGLNSNESTGAKAAQVKWLRKPGHHAACSRLPTLSSTAHDVFVPSYGFAPVRSGAMGSR